MNRAALIFEALSVLSDEVLLPSCDTVPSISGLSCNYQAQSEGTISVAYRVGAPTEPRRPPYFYRMGLTTSCEAIERESSCSNYSLVPLIYCETVNFHDTQRGQSHRRRYLRLLI